MSLVRPLVVGRERWNVVDLEGLTAREVTEFVLAECQRRPAKGAQHLASALRSLLRFLHVNGLVATALADAVPSVANWRLAGLPRFLEPEQVEALLASCDQDSANGRRDFAILMMLARLGLRAGEVAGLRLDDIDWRCGQVAVRGKGSRVEMLPLPVEVGRAVAVYLRDGRPAAALDRSVFIRIMAPHHGLTSTGVTQAVAAAGRRAGLGTIYAHRLRHSAATQLLRAGSPLAEIGQVLRHRRLSTTAIYAKVDTAGLRALARPWPITAGGGR